MTTLSIKDSLRQSVEAASGGLQTVLYTAKGQPTYMNIVEKFDLSTIDSTLSGTHPAFIINGVEKDKIFIGTYQGVVRNGELLSLPNQAPNLLLAYDAAIASARANGAGHHVITNAEWSALALTCLKNKTIPRGNSYYGRSVQDATQLGRRVDGLSATAGITTGSPQVFTGSGPVSWRHNLKYNGISDLVGNGSEHILGVRLVNKEIQVIANNDAAILSTDISATSTSWKAIDAVTGALITPDGNGTTANSIKFAYSGTDDYTIVRPNWAVFYKDFTNPSPTKPVSTVALNVLKALLLHPTATDGYDNSTFGFSTNVAESLMSRGGGYSEGASTGMFYNALMSTRVSPRATRPCYYTP